MAESRTCVRCGNTFQRHPKDSATQWRGRRYCGKLCANKTAGDTRMRALGDRYWDSVETFKNGCWKWRGRKDNHGYGTMSAGRRDEGSVRATRVSWSLHFGEIPKGLHVLHACDNPECTNPDHLMLGTATANAIDCSRKNRNHSNSLKNLRGGAPGVVGAAPRAMENN